MTDRFVVELSRSYDREAPSDVTRDFDGLEAAQEFAEGQLRGNRWRRVTLRRAGGPVSLEERLAEAMPELTSEQVAGIVAVQQQWVREQSALRTFAASYDYTDGGHPKVLNDFLVSGAFGRPLRIRP